MVLFIQPSSLVLAKQFRNLPSSRLRGFLEATWFAKRKSSNWKWLWRGRQLIFSVCAFIWPLGLNVDFRLSLKSLSWALKFFGCKALTVALMGLDFLETHRSTRISEKLIRWYSWSLPQFWFEDAFMKASSLVYSLSNIRFQLIIWIYDP